MLGLWTGIPHTFLWPSWQLLLVSLGKFSLWSKWYAALPGVHCFGSSTWIAPINGLSPFSIFMAVYHLWGTLVSWSAMFLFDGTNTTSTVNSYSSKSFFRMFRHLLISILVAALVHTRILPVRVSNTQWCTHTVCFHVQHFALPLES